MTAIDRAADAIGDAWVVFKAEDGIMSVRAKSAVEIAEALADAGLLVTDEIQAVLDCAEAIAFGPTGGPYVLAAAVDAYLATRQVPT